MSPSRSPRYTIGQLMLVIAVLAGSLAVPRLLDSPDRPILLCAAGALAAFALIDALVARSLGKVCPGCRRRAMWPLARHPDYYRCSSCRGRYKRSLYGPWRDASGPEDEARYRRPSEAGSWTEFEVPSDLKGSNSGALLASKRFRDPFEEIRRHPPRPGPGRRLEEAERKVRAFLKRRDEVED